MNAVALCLTLCGLLLSSATVHAAWRQPQVLVEAAEAGRSISATGVTTQPVHEGQPRFRALLHTVDIGGISTEVSLPVLVFGSFEDSADIGIGTRVQLTGRLAATAPQDAAAFLIFTDGSPVVTSPPPGYLDWANDLRRTFLDAAMGLPGDGGALLPGLAIGDTTAVSDSLDESMKASSLSHLTAVSGANCAVVIGLVLLCGRALGLPRGWRIGASLFILLAFVTLVTPEPSVLRAAVMAALVLLAMAVGRPVSGVPVLALAAVGLLAFDPWLARSYGFTLSVLATAGLLTLAGPLARKLGRWLPYPIAVAISVPLAAQLACQPVLILLNPSLPTYGVIANVLAGPAAPVATIAGLIACLILPALPMAGMMIAHIAWLPSAWIAGVATFFSRLPGASLPWPGGGAGVMLLLTAATIMLLVVLRPAFLSHSMRRVAAFVLAAGCAVYFGSVGGEQLRRRLSPPTDWNIASCDVGQGDAILVRSAGAVALIDTGPDPELLSYCLSTLGVNHLDLLVLTHFDADHVGGASAVLGQPAHVLAGPSSEPADELLLSTFAQAGALIDRPSRGHSGELGELRWRVLWPPAKLIGVVPGNQASVAMSFRGVEGCGNACIGSVFLGDLGEQSQSMLLATNPLGAVDVVHVSHHGSADQDARLYTRLDAAIGLIGVGAENRYGHPSADILHTLAGIGTTVARTDHNGMALVSSTVRGVELWTERNAATPPD
ncbi:MAG: ComEC/Rec2 family competence protein [Homoserinimonas sp.]|nr:ComEC/Rec2 family competence protein [Homoserinimonas sp.]